MTKTLRELHQQALNALAECLYASTNKSERMANAAVEALTAALALPDEPVAWRINYTGADGIEYRRIFGHNAIGDYRAIDPKATSTPLYATPQSAPLERQPLTDEQITEALHSVKVALCMVSAPDDITEFRRIFVRAIEKSHGIKGAA